MNMSPLPLDVQQTITEDTGIPFEEIADMDWRKLTDESRRK